MNVDRIYGIYRIGKGIFLFPKANVFGFGKRKSCLSCHKFRLYRFRVRGLGLRLFEQLLYNFLIRLQQINPWQFSQPHPSYFRMLQRHRFLG